MLAMGELVKALAAVDRLKHEGLLTEAEYRAHVDPYVREHGMDSLGLATHIAELVLSKTKPANDGDPTNGDVAA